MQIVRYAFIGVISTLIHLIVAYALIYYFGSSVLISNVVAFMIAFVFSYTTQSIVTFRNQLSISKSVKFFIIQFGVLLISIFISEILKQNDYIKTIFVIILMPIITFFIHKFWTFR